MSSARPAGSASLATALIPGVIAGVAVAWALSGQRWLEWGVAAMAPTTPSPTSFADLANITATAQCLQDGTDITGCDPYGRPFQPYVVLPARVLALVGLGTDATGPLGTALAVLFVLVAVGLGVVLARQWRGHLVPLVGGQVLIGLLAVTAPAMLAVERGQIEILTLALAVVGLLLLSRTSIAAGVTGAVAATAAVVTKFFAIGLFAPFVRRGRPSIPALTALGISLVLLAASWSDLQQASDAARAGEPATSKSQFGAFAMIATLLSDVPVGYTPSPGVVEDWSTVRMAGWAVTTVAILAAAALVRPRQVASLAAQPAAHALVLGSAGVLAVPYVLGSSHDYRLVFLLPLVTGALMWVSTGRAGVLPWLLVVGAALSMVTGAAMEPAPDGFLWPKAALVAGDAGLLVVLAACGGLWLRGLWTPVSGAVRA